jgi:hypothetical protein
MRVILRLRWIWSVGGMMLAGMETEVLEENLFI